MPSVSFTVRWPDGSVRECSCPSRSIEGALVAGGVYPVAEFVRRCETALREAEERVRARYGFACTAARAEAAAIRETGAGAGDGAVRVERMEREGRRPPAPTGSVDGHHEAIVVGGGQAGLSMAACLSRRGVGHLVVERNRVGHSWRAERWDSFCLVTPNFQCRLPGMGYAGPDPDGFMVRDEIVSFIEDYARAVDPPLVEGAAVRAVDRDPAGRLRVVTDAGTATADAVVLAVGGYHVPVVPRLAERLPRAVTQLHSSRYRNPGSLPDGAVLVVGSGQSGAQIAEDLHLAGREVHLSVGGAPRVARRHRGRDCVAWLEDMGHYDLSIDRHPQGTEARHEANHYVTGRDGGRDIDLRAHARDGMRLHGRLLDIEGWTAVTGDDLGRNLDAADATNARILAGIDSWIEANGIDAPPAEPYRPVWHPPAQEGPAPLDLVAEGITSVVWATGFRSDWSWVRLPAFDGTGYPEHERGVTSVEGLYVLGLPWLHTWGSGRFAGIARDAEHLAGRIASRVAV